MAYFAFSITKLTLMVFTALSISSYTAFTATSSVMSICPNYDMNTTCMFPKKLMNEYVGKYMCNWQLSASWKV